MSPFWGCIFPPSLFPPSRRDWPSEWSEMLKFLGRVMGAPDQNPSLGAPHFAHLLPRLSGQQCFWAQTPKFKPGQWGLLTLLTCCHAPPNDTVLRIPCSSESLFPHRAKRLVFRMRGDVLDILGVLNARENRYNLLIHGVLTGLEKWCLGVFTDWEKMCLTICERYLFSFKGVTLIFLVCYQFQKNNSWFVNSSWAREKYLPFKGVTSIFLLCYQFQKNILDMLIALELVRNIFLLKVWPRYSWCVNSSTVGRLVPRPRS